MIFEPALYVVATPIGNLSDITARAVEVLQRVDIILAEDTRHSLPLLKEIGVTHPTLESFHDHNDDEKAERVVSWIKDNKSIAIISDAGTPLINDPGYRLVYLCREKGVKVVPIPGPCALITAICASGLPTDSFSFEGFLPTKEKQLIAYLEGFAKLKRTLIFYETPKRIIKTSEVLAKIFEDRPVCVARELTKQFETFYYAKANTLKDELLKDPNYLKGEMVLMIGPYEEDEDLSDEEIFKMLKILLKNVSLSDASKIVSEYFGVNKNEIYAKALTLTKNN